MFFGSYINHDASFQYNLPVLKEEIINYAVEHDYELNYRQQSSY